MSAAAAGAFRPRWKKIKMRRDKKMLHKFGRRLGQRVTIRFDPEKSIVGKDGNSVFASDPKGEVYAFDFGPFLRWIRHRFTCPFAVFLKFDTIPPTMVVHIAHWEIDESALDWKPIPVVHVVATSDEIAKIAGKATSVTILSKRSKR